MKHETKKESGISALRSALGAIPYAGQLLNEVLFEYRGRIRQNRLNSFTELLSEFFTCNQDIDLANLKSEDFGDLIESVLKRVVQTKSLEKLKRFRDVLINKIQDPTVDIDNSEIYLDLISALNDDELKILYHHQIFDEKYDLIKKMLKDMEEEHIRNQNSLKKNYEYKKNGKANSYEVILSQVVELQEKIRRTKSELANDFEKYRKAEIYGLSTDRFLYYKQSLFSKGLLIDSGIGAIGVNSFEIMSITNFGREFIRFIIKK